MAKAISLFQALFFMVFAAACNLPAVNTLTPTIEVSTTEPATSLATSTFLVGDLGWGAIHGTVTDAASGLPIANATVTCRHSSYTSPSLCNTSTVTDKDGKYTFAQNFFHDTDRVQLEVQAQGYVTQSMEVNFLTSPWLNADFTLISADTNQQPEVTCTQPACAPYEALMCSQGDCPNGCGYVCATPAAICTPPICAIGVNEVYYCSGVCPGGCGTTCATITPSP